MAIIVGSARIDEHGNISGGASGDQTGKEVATQNFYVHPKGWYIIRPKSVAHANSIASKMVAACANDNIGYDQGNRLGVIQNGIDTKVKTEADCSSLVRVCVKEATGKDPGDFSTANEVSCLATTGLFENKVKFVSQAQTPVYNGDILVTCTKGHTVIVVAGNPRSGGTPASKLAQQTATGYATYSGSYKVTTNLNMRHGAGTGNGIVVVVPKGTVVECYGDYSMSGSTPWLYVQAIINGVTYTGFCSKPYLQKV